MTSHTDSKPLLHPWHLPRSAPRRYGRTAVSLEATAEPNPLSRRQRHEGLSAEFVSLHEAASIVGISKNTVRNWITRGKLKAITIGRIVRVRRDELEALMTKGDSGDDRPTVDTQADDILASLKTKASRKKG